MLKNKAIQMKVVKDKPSKNTSDESVEPTKTPEEIANLITDVVAESTEIVQKAVVQTLIVATGCKIAVILAKAIVR